MTNKKLKDNVWDIFTRGLSLYFTNFGTFVKYMAFPVLGQLLGIILVFGASFIYMLHLADLAAKFPIFADYSVIFIVLLIICLPGLFILMKAFWDYLVVYGAVNSMVDNALRSGKIYDIPAHTATVSRRIGVFVGVWLLWGILQMIGSVPFFTLITWILSIFFVLIFQVFSFDEGSNPITCFKKSFLMIKGNFWKTLLLIALIGLFTYVLIPLAFEVIFGIASLTVFFASLIQGWVAQFPIDEFGLKFSAITLSTFVVGSVLWSVVTAFTLPLRCICWALWYKALDTTKDKKEK